MRPNYIDDVSQNLSVGPFEAYPQLLCMIWQDLSWQQRDSLCHRCPHYWRLWYHDAAI